MYTERAKSKRVAEVETISVNRTIMCLQDRESNSSESCTMRKGINVRIMIPEPFLVLETVSTLASAD